MPASLIIVLAAVALVAACLLADTARLRRQLQESDDQLGLDRWRRWHAKFWR